MLADVSIHTGSGALHDLWILFLCILGGLIIYALGKYFFPRLKVPPGGMMVWDGIFILIAAIIALNFIAGLAGHRFIDW
jgi:hypothetical protein